MKCIYDGQHECRCKASICNNFLIRKAFLRSESSLYNVYKPDIPLKSRKGAIHCLSAALIHASGIQSNRPCGKNATF